MFHYRSGAFCLMKRWRRETGIRQRPSAAQKAEHMVAPSSLVQPGKDLAARDVPHKEQTHASAPIQIVKESFLSRVIYVIARLDCISGKSGL